MDVDCGVVDQSIQGTGEVEERFGDMFGALNANDAESAEWWTPVTNFDSEDAVRERMAAGTAGECLERALAGETDFVLGKS